MNLINQYSYLLIGVGTLSVSILFFRNFLRARWYITVGVNVTLIMVFAIAFTFLRVNLIGVDSTERTLATIGNGQPTFVEFFSNYCAGCLSMNPIVNQIVVDIDDEFNVLRVDIHSSVGREIRQELGFSFTPEFVLYDLDGDEIWRSHIPPSNNDLDKARQ